MCVCQVAVILNNMCHPVAFRLLDLGVVTDARRETFGDEYKHCGLSACAL